MTYQADAIPKQHRKSCGASLLELLMAVTILSVIVSISIPATAAVARKTEAQKNISIIARWLSVLHSKSLNEQKTISVRITDKEILAFDEHAKLLARRKIPPLTTLAFSSKTIQFYGTGVQSPSTVRLTHGGTVCLCRLSLRGRITTECL